MEQPKGLASINLQKKIKTNIGIFGIEGEFGIVSPARSIEEHVRIALGKNYTTIVGIGSEKLINKIIPHIIDKNVVLGIVPIKASKIITDLIGSDEIESACQALKFRRIKSLDIGLVEPSRLFIGKLELGNSANPTKIGFKIDGYESDIEITELVVYSPSVFDSHRIGLYLRNENDEPNIISKGLYWLFGKRQSDIYTSFLRGNKIKLSTDQPIPVICDGEIIAKTPISVRIVVDALKIIIKRASIIKDKK